MNDRDTFAAAALTGLISLNSPGPNQQLPAELCERSFRWADAMLRERERTNHDAVPEAKAAEPESPVPLGSGAAPANIPDSRTEAQRPVAWLGEWTDYALVWLRKEEADRYAKEYDIRPIPLYRSPSLTTEERQAVWHYATEFKGPNAAILRKLLERLK
jgi:hypothetical protein